LELLETTQEFTSGIPTHNKVSFLAFAAQGTKHIFRINWGNYCMCRSVGCLVVG